MRESTEEIPSLESILTRYAHVAFTRLTPKGKIMFDMNTEVLLASDFEASNDDEAYVQNGSLTGRITDLSANEDKYFVTFDDTAKEDEGDIGFWVDVDQVELA